MSVADGQLHERIGTALGLILRSEGILTGHHQCRDSGVRQKFFAGHNLMGV
jgi:hypothetical protein